MCVCVCDITEIRLSSLDPFANVPVARADMELIKHAMQLYEDRVREKYSQGASTLTLSSSTLKNITLHLAAYAIPNGKSLMVSSS